jgi:hypothetical protein
MQPYPFFIVQKSMLSVRRMATEIDVRRSPKFGTGDCTDIRQTRGAVKKQKPKNSPYCMAAI